MMVANSSTVESWLEEGDCYKVLITEHRDADGTLLNTQATCYARDGMITFSRWVDQWKVIELNGSFCASLSRLAAQEKVEEVWRARLAKLIVL